MQTDYNYIKCITDLTKFYNIYKIINRGWNILKYNHLNRNYKLVFSYFL